MNSRRNDSIIGEYIPIIIVVGAFILLMLVCGRMILSKINNGQLRNMATEEMSLDYYNVYADVIRIDPEFFVYSQWVSHGSQIGDEDFNAVVAKCMTVEGKEIWAVFPIMEYPGCTYASKEDDVKPVEYISSSPIRLIGSISNSELVADDLEKEIGKTFVLRVEKTEK